MARLGARPKSLSVFFIAIAAVAFLLHSSQLHVKIAHYGRLYDDDEVDEVSRVQSDSEGGGSPSWWKHATSIFFPPTAPSLVDIALDGSWRGNNITAFNERNVALLESCRSGGKCKKNQDKLVILAWGHFAATLRGSMQGEDVWCDSVMDAMHALGYSMLIMDNQMDAIDKTYREYHDAVQLVLWNDGNSEGHECMRDPTCTHLNPEEPVLPPNATHLNIPIWKIFSLHWWNGDNHPLGGPFTLSPENYTYWAGGAGGAENYFLGYSLWKTCLKTPYVPPVSRPRHAYIFAKYLHYFTDNNFILRADGVENIDQVHTDFFQVMSERANMTFLANFHHDTPEGVDPPLGITEMPRMERTEFQNTIARTRLVMGLGSPLLSPTPWESLCLGVPFLNPIKNWDRNHPENREKWVAQHDGVLYLGVDEPYVYHVKLGDREALEAAVTKAMDTPIERWTAPHMEMGALIDRVQRLIETDWRPTAQAQIIKIAEKNGS